MTAPRLGQGMPPNDGYLMRLIQDLQRQITELRAARTLEAATIGQGGLTVAGGSITIAGGSVKSSNFDGDVNAPAAGTVGFGLGGASGNAVFNNLTLRGNIIGNAALTNPVAPAVANGAAGGFTFTVSSAVYETVNVTVPAGFSQALVMAVSTGGMTCNSSGGSSLFVQPRINGVLGQSIAATCQPSLSMSVSAPFASLVTGLTGGGSFPIDTLASANIPGNVLTGTCNAQVSATIMFLR